jgi:hypothetical protein
VPQQAWNRKRERQYEHIKGGLKERGRSEDEAEEIAARTVNKERARSGEARQKSRTSVRDISSGRRGGLRSHRGPGGRTKEQLYEEAKRKGIEGRSKMNKEAAGAGGRPLGEPAHDVEDDVDASLVVVEVDVSTGSDLDEHQVRDDLARPEVEVGRHGPADAGRVRGEVAPR